MKPRHQVSRAALELIERFEGYRRKAARLPDGRWTIGYGHTKTARDGAEVSPGDAEALLIYDLIEVSAGVNEWTFAPLSQNQFDALCAFALNVGLDNFRASQVLRKVNEGAPLQAACAMDMWRRAEFEGESIVVDALVRRRAAEKALFLTAPGVHAPTPILPPQLDEEAFYLVPRHEPVEVGADMEGEQAIAERVSQPAAADLSTAPWPVFEPQDAESALADEPQRVSPEAEPQPHAEAAAADEAESPPPPLMDEDLRPGAASESEPEQLAPDQPALAERVSLDQSRRVVQPHAAIDELEPFPDSEDEVVASNRPPPEAWFAGLGVVGLAIFAGALYFGLSTRHAVPWQFGVSLGVVGIGCVAIATYFLLERLGAREE